MMREIKFRIWDPFNGTMVYSDRAASLSDFFIDYELRQVNGNEPVLMQFTGLFKHGPQIYEGDIILARPYSLPIVVIFKDGAFGIHTKYGFWPLCDPEENFDSIEPLGNIYENPELRDKIADPDLIRVGQVLEVG